MSPVAKAIMKVRAMRKELDDLETELVHVETGEAKKIPERMRIEAYARHRDVSVRTVYRWIELGMAGVERRGKVTRIVVAEADAWDEHAAIARHAEIDAARDKEG